MQAVIIKYAQIFLTRIDPGCAQAVSYQKGMYQKHIHPGRLKDIFERSMIFQI